jgi:leucine-zipper of insertion element IS481
MKLHANAALSWSGRRRLVERVVVEGWTLGAAAEAAGVSVRRARKWLCRVPSEPNVTMKRGHGPLSTTVSGSFREGRARRAVAE